MDKRGKVFVLNKDDLGLIPNMPYRSMPGMILEYSECGPETKIIV